VPNKHRICRSAQNKAKLKNKKLTKKSLYSIIGSIIEAYGKNSWKQCAPVDYPNNAKNLQLCTANPTRPCCQERAAGHWISNSALNTSENNKWEKNKGLGRFV